MKKQPISMIYSDGSQQAYASEAKFNNDLYKRLLPLRGFRVGRFSVNYMQSGALGIAAIYDLSHAMADDKSSPYRAGWKASRLDLLAELSLDLEGLERFENQLPPEFEALRADMAAEVLAWNS